MKKSVRINLLVITTVLAIFVFAGVWYLRPDVSNDVLERAKQRQLQPLLEVSEPLRLSQPAETATVSDLDLDAIADKLLPTLTASLEDTLYEDISQRLAQDPVLLSDLSDAIAPQLSEQLGASAGSAAAKAVREADIDGRLESLRQSLLAELGARVAALRAEMTAQTDRQISSLEDRLPENLDAYIPQLVDQLLPQVAEQVYRDLEDNRDTYLPILAEAVAPLVDEPLDEQQLVALYLQYRDQIVADLVPSILDSLEESAYPLASQQAPAATEPAEVPPLPPATAGTPIQTVPSEPETPAVPAPAVSTTQTVSPEPEIPAVPAPPAPQAVSSTPVPVAPSAPTVNSTVDNTLPEFVDPETYEQERTNIRQQAIDDILNRLKDED